MAPRRPVRETPRRERDPADRSASFYLAARTRWRPIEVAFWLATLLPFVLTPTYLTLASQIAITAIFALSLDLILGYAGIVSLGHAAFFGLGAYTAGLAGQGRLGRAAVRPAGRRRGRGRRRSAMPELRRRAGPASRPDHDHARHRPAAVRELANSAGWLTGGNDGLQGVGIWKLFGWFEFDLYGNTAYAYALAVLFAAVPGRAAADPLAVRPVAARHPRERAAHAGDRRADPRADPHRLHHRRRHRRDRRRRCWRRPRSSSISRFARLPALGRFAGDAGARRHRPAVWRPRRRHRVHGRARPASPA